jgi:hypothetical protein
LRKFVSVAALAVAGVGAPAAMAAALPRAGETFAVERNGYLVGRPPTGWTRDTSFPRSLSARRRLGWAGPDPARDSARKAQDLPDLRARRTESGAGRSAGREVDPLSLLERPPREARGSGLWRHRLGRMGNEARRQAAYEPHRQGRAPRRPTALAFSTPRPSAPPSTPSSSSATCPTPTAAAASRLA